MRVRISNDWFLVVRINFFNFLVMMLILNVLSIFMVLSMSIEINVVNNVEC